MNILQLTKEELNRFEMVSLEDFLADFQEGINSEINYYKTFLIKTDYIVLKMLEDDFLGENPKEEDFRLISLRKQARQKINELQKELEKEVIN